MTCIAIRADGQPCQGPPRPSGYCWAHDSELRARAADARRNGGKNRSHRARAVKALPKDMQDLGRRLLEAFEETHAGHLDPQRAHAMSSLARTYLVLVEHGEMAADVEQMKSLLEERGRWRA